MERRIEFSGMQNPVLIIAFRYASYRFSPKHATSPVDAISTPNIKSAPASRENENWGTFTPTFPQPDNTSTGSTFSPTITRVAIATKSWSNVFETNGKDRETRTLHSITFRSLS